MVYTLPPLALSARATWTLSPDWGVYGRTVRGAAPRPVLDVAGGDGDDLAVVGGGDDEADLVAGRGRSIPSRMAASMAALSGREPHAAETHGDHVAADLPRILNGAGNVAVEHQDHAAVGTQGRGWPWEPTRRRRLARG